MPVKELFCMLSQRQQFASKFTATFTQLADFVCFFSAVYIPVNNRLKEIIHISMSPSFISSVLTCHWNWLLGPIAWFVGNIWFMSLWLSHSLFKMYLLISEIMDFNVICQKKRQKLGSGSDALGFMAGPHKKKLWRVQDTEQNSTRDVALLCLFLPHFTLDNWTI